MYCTRCGIPNVATAVYCKSCGNGVAEKDNYKQFKQDVHQTVWAWRLRIRWLIGATVGGCTLQFIWDAYPTLNGLAAGCIVGWCCGALICRDHLLLKRLAQGMLLYAVVAFGIVHLVTIPSYETPRQTDGQLVRQLLKENPAGLSDKKRAKILKDVERAEQKQH